MILGSSSASKCLVGQRPSRHGHASCPIFAIWRSPIIHLVCPPKLCITFVFHFSWVLQSSQQKLTTMFMQSVFWGGRGEERGGGKQGALLNDSHTFSLKCSRSLFVSPCPPECYIQSETKIEPDLARTFKNAAKSFCGLSLRTPTSKCKSQ